MIECKKLIFKIPYICMYINKIGLIKNTLLNKKNSMKYQVILYIQ